MQRGTQTNAQAQEYVGARSITVVRARHGNRHNADRYVAAVKRETGLPFHWEEETRRTWRFFTEENVTEDELQRLLNAAHSHLPDLRSQDSAFWG